MCIQSLFGGRPWPVVRGERAPWEAEGKPGNIQWGQTLEGQECWAESHGHNQCCCWWIGQHHWVSRKCTARAPKMPNIDYQTRTNILGGSVSKSSSHWECELNHFLPWISYWYRYLWLLWLFIRGWYEAWVIEFVVCFNYLRNCKHYC